jgi:hypothetical protein
MADERSRELTGKYRKPTAGPNAMQVEDQQRWKTLVDNSLSSTQAAAEKWRTGLAAFVTLITTALVIKGPTSASDLEGGWRTAVTVLFAGGLAAAIIGLWQCLRAAAGSPSDLNFQALIATYGSVAEFEIASARVSASALRTAKKWVAFALLLLGVGVVVWWSAPAPAKKPAALVKVVHVNKTACGELRSADNSTLRVKVAGESRPQTIPFDEVTNVYVVATC